VGNGALKESIDKSGYLCGVMSGTKIEGDDGSARTVELRLLLCVGRDKLVHLGGLGGVWISEIL
jgi:hypothetical protein